MAEVELLTKKRLSGDEEDSSNIDGDEDKSGRGQWSNRVEFFLAIVGYTVGIGSIWRFPIMCAKNGGGAFLIPFFLFMAACGGPLYYMEVCLGQFCSKSPIAAFEFCPLFKGLGWLMTTLSFVVVMYIMTVMAWIMYFFYSSFFSPLPWAACDHWWNTPQCLKPARASSANIVNTTAQGIVGNVTYAVSTTVSTTTMIANATGQIIVNGTGQSPALEFWRYNVLRESSSLEDVGSIQWHIVLCLFLAYVIVVASVIKGVQSLGKVVYVTATLPYVLLTVMFVRGLTLDGAVDGIIYYLTPDFEKLTHVSIWTEAAIQVFYSLGPTWGGCITMASYNKFHQKSHVETALCVFADAFTAFYSGLVVFTIVGFMAKEAGIPVHEAATVSGPGLAFVAYPTALNKMPLPQMWSVLFFLMMITVAFDSDFGMFETVTNAIIDSRPKQLTKRRALVNGITGLVLFLIGLSLTFSNGIFLFKLLDWYASAFALIIGSLLEAVTVCWIYGADRFSKDIQMMTGRDVSVILRLLWTVITPSVLMVCFVVLLTGYSEPDYGNDYKYQPYAIAIGFIVGLLPIAALVGVGLLQIFKTEGSLKQRLKTLLQPSPKWGPRGKSNMAVYRSQPYRHPDKLCARIRLTIRGDKSTPIL